MKVKKVAEKWEIWDEKEEAAKLEEKVKGLVPECFHKWIYIFGKKQSERMPTEKPWDHTIETKEGFVPRKRKVDLLSREKREEVHEFILKQLRKGYIGSLKLNEGMIRNNYSLPLISGIVENIDTDKVFTKMGLQWGYNNL